MTDRATLEALLARVLEGTGPDRELDAEIAVALFGGEIIWKTARYTMDAYPARRIQNSAYVGGYQNAGVLAYTESLDAIISRPSALLAACGRWANNARHLPLTPPHQPAPS